MIPTPKRTSLVAQVADILREGLSKREWVDRLPGERRLCSELKVSRTTVRKALAQLNREGLIKISHGLYSKIEAPAKRAPIPSHTKLVGILSVKPLYDNTGPTLYLVSELQNDLHELGYGLVIYADRRLQKRNPLKILDNIVQHTKASCWVLAICSREIQQWFVDRKIPAIVLGCCFEGIHLPSFDIDNHALCRHAAGVFLRKGHRRVALLMVATGRATDVACEQGFHQAFQTTVYPDASPIVIYHDGTVAGIRSAVTPLLQSQHPPTAFVVSHAEHLITLISHLVNLGLRVPCDVSLISRDDDPLLSYFVPSLTRYTYDRAVFLGRFRRLVLQLATSGALPARQVRIMPDFLKGETIAPPKT